MTSEWSSVDLWKLFTAMRDNLLDISLRRPLKWNNVAFPPFSAADCELKWNGITKQRGNKSQSKTYDVKGLPTKPPFCGYNLFCKDQADSNPGKKNSLNFWAKRWKVLPQLQKTQYQIRCTELKKEYLLKLDKYLEKLIAEQEENIPRSNSEIYHKGITSATERNPGRTSDSEDDDIEFSSSEEEGNNIYFEDETDEEEHEDEVVMFQIY